MLYILSILQHIVLVRCTGFGCRFGVEGVEVVDAFFTEESQEVRELLHKEAAFLRLGRSPGGFGDSYQAGESHIVQTLGISDPFRPKGELEAHHLVFIIACQMDDRFGETVDVLDRVVTAPHTAHLMAAVLDEVGIQRTARGHNHPVAVFERLHQLVFAVVAPPHDDSLVGRDTGIDHLVPADHRLALGSHDIGSTADKILFQARFVA